MTLFESCKMVMSGIPKIDWLYWTYKAAERSVELLDLITFEECLAPPSQNRKANITERGMTFECVRCGVMMPKLYKKDFRKAKGFLNQICECGCNNRIIQGFGYSWYDYEAFQERERKFKVYQQQKYGVTQ